MGNKYTKSFLDAFKMYLEILPRQAVYEEKFKCISNIFDSLVVI